MSPPGGASLLTAQGLLEAEARAGSFPGGVVGCLTRDGAAILPFGALDYSEDASRVEEGTTYDLASLTKVIGTTTALMRLVEEGLDIEAPVSRFLPRFGKGEKAGIRLRHLLAHSSGLPAHRPLYQNLRGREAYLAGIAALPLDAAPGSRGLYSDLGFITLGFVLEAATGEALDHLVNRLVLGPLGMDETGYLPPPERHARIAPTEIDPWRGRLLRGEVHDENAFALGGVSGHAGLFGTAGDLARFSQMILDGGLHDWKPFLSPHTLARFFRREGTPGSSRALGWDTPSPGSSAGDTLSEDAIGHTGFTGTSLWIDRGKGLGILLLTNRVHPTRENTRIFEVRRRVADLLSASASSGSRPGSPS